MKLLSAQQAAELYTELTGKRMSKRRIAQLVEAGKLPSVKAEGVRAILIERGALVKFAATPRPSGRPRKRE